MIDTPRTLAVRRSLRKFLDRRAAESLHLSPGDEVVCGVSGGGDSLALAAACVHAGLAVTTVTVDHGLQDGSAEVAARAARICTDLGATAEVATVTVSGSGEAAARDARYAALGEYAAGRPVLVAHTADDDAEGLLLSLSRGSGTGSLAGLREVADDHPVVTAGAAWLGRPLLDVTRNDTLGSCAELGLVVWHDPHNTSADITRSRVRHELLPLAREILGDHVDASLSRSARLLRQDADLLDAQATEILENAGERTHGEEGSVLQVSVLEGEPAPLRRRVIRQWLADAAGPLTSRHLDMLDALVADWHGQGPVAVPYPVSEAPSTMRVTRRLVVRRRRTATGSHLEIDRSAGVSR
jgi:tRNA(Ile)-lysidine synthase